MADKKILFQLEIEGGDVSVRTVNELTAAIKATNTALKDTELGTEEYRKLERQLGALKNAQKDVSDSARLAQRALEADANAGQNTYRQLNAQLVNARALFKELTAEERQGNIGQSLIADIKRLDAELKDIDATIGQFQRNVGNYSGGIQDAFSKISPSLGQAIPGFSQLSDAALLVKDGISGIGETAGATGKLLVGAFIGLQVVGAILDGVSAVREFADEINNLRGQLGQLSDESGPALDKATAQVEAIRATFNAGTEETIQAANALDKAFDDIDLSGSLDLIEQGFLSGANAGGELLDVLKEYPRLFDQMGFSAEEFLTIQAKAGQEGVFSDKGVDAVKEFGIRIREQTVATRTSLEQAFGQEFTSNLFKGLNSGALSVKDALVQVSGKLRDTELPAKQLQQVISDVFGGPGEDAGDKFLKSLADIDKGINENIDSQNEYIKRQQEQLAAEKELAAAKVEVTAKLNDLTGGYSALGKNVQTFGINILGRFLEAAKPVRDAFGRLSDSVVGFLRQIGLLPAEGEKTVGFLEVLGGALNIVASAISITVDSAATLFGWLKSLFTQSGAAAQQFGILGDTIRFFGNAARTFLDIIANFPAYFAGAVEAGKQFGSNIATFFRELVVDAQILFAELQKINPFNENDAELDRQIADLKGRKAEIQGAGRTIAEAFKAGFDSVNKPVLDIVAPDRGKSTAGGKPTGGGTVTPGATSEEIKKQGELNAAALAAQEKYNDQRIELLRVLSRRLADANIEAIDNESERQIAAERLKFEDLKAELSKQEAALIAAQKAAREKIVAASGEGSTQVKAFDAQAAADLEAEREAARAVTEQNEKNHLQRIEKIRNDAANNAARAELERLKASLDNRDKQFADAAQREETRAKAQINRILNATGLSDQQKAELVVKLTFETDSSSLQQESIRIFDQIQTIENRLRELSENDDLQQASIEEFEFLSDQLDALYNKRAETELAYTELVQSESERRNESRAGEIAKVLETVGQIIDIADQFAAASAQRELQNIQEKEEARRQSIASIEKQLQTATGVEKKNLETRLKQEQDGLKKLEEERKRVEKEEAKRAKQFAIIQAIISTAAAVAKTLATLGVPAGIPAAALAGALGLAQVAIIAAQPAATGALIGADIHNQGAGVVVARQNIPELSNGDNVLATLRRGEVVLNKRQQAALGGAPTFRAIQVPGFAEGGAAGSIIAAPDVTGTSTAERIRLLEKISGQMLDNLEATNARIDRMRAYVVSEDIRDDLAEGDSLEVRATLSAG